jgi:serine/threonine-protein kinase
MKPAPLHRVGPYQLVERLGSDLWGTLYLGKLVRLGGFKRFVTIKVMHAHLVGDRDISKKFLEEARIAAGIQHPNVVSTLDIDCVYGQVCLVMEHVEGSTLDQVLSLAADDTDVLPLPITLRIAQDVLAGLHAAHQLESSKKRPAGVVHGDVAPRNVLIGRDGVARVTGFGAVPSSARRSLSGTGANVLSSTSLAGLELARDVDLVAFGTVLWEMLTGRRLERPTIPGVPMSVPHTRPRQWAPVPAAVDDVCMRALGASPQGYTSAAELCDALAEAAAEAHVGIASSHTVAEYLRALEGSRGRAGIACTRERPKPRAGSNVDTAPLPQFIRATTPELDTPDERTRRIVSPLARASASVEELTQKLRSLIARPSAVEDEDLTRRYESPLSQHDAEEDMTRRYVAPSERMRAALEREELTRRMSSPFEAEARGDFTLRVPRGALDVHPSAFPPPRSADKRASEKRPIPAAARPRPVAVDDAGGLARSVAPRAVSVPPPRARGYRNGWGGALTRLGAGAFAGLAVGLIAVAAWRMSLEYDHYLETRLTPAAARLADAAPRDGKGAAVALPATSALQASIKPATLVPSPTPLAVPAVRQAEPSRSLVAAPPAPRNTAALARTPNTSRAETPPRSESSARPTAQTAKEAPAKAVAKPAPARSRTAAPKPTETERAEPVTKPQPTRSEPAPASTPKAPVAVSRPAPRPAPVVAAPVDNGEFTPDEL